MPLLLAKEKTENVARALFSVEVSLAKAAFPDNPSAPFLLIEQRVFRSLWASWKSHARRAVDGAAQYIDSGTGMVSSADVVTAKSIMNREMSAWSGGLGPVINAAVDASYETSKIWAMNRIFGDAPPPEGLDRDFEETAQGVAKQDDSFDQFIPPVSIDLSPNFGFVDSSIVSQIKSQHTFWIGRSYNEHLSGRISAVASHVLLEQGLGREAAGLALKEALEAEFGLSTEGLYRPDGLEIPKGWKGPTRQYFNTVAAEVATRARVYGAVQTFREAGITHYEIVAMRDERTCPVCRFMDGKVFSIQDGEGLLGEVARAGSPEDVIRATKWRSLKDIQELTGVTELGVVDEADAEKLASIGLALPSYHGLCRCTVDITTDFRASFPSGPDNGPLPF